MDDETDRRQDLLLITRCQLGEPEALDQLVLRWHGPIYRFIWRMIGSEAEAEEVSQDFWIRVMRALPKLRDCQSPSAWMFSISRRCVLDRIRTRYRAAGGERETLDDAALVEAADDGAEEFEVTEQLAAALDHLQPELRECVVLRYYENVPVERIGKLTGVPPGTVKSRLHRARAELRKYLYECETRGIRK